MSPRSPASFQPPRDAPPADHADWFADIAAYCIRQARAAASRGDRVDKWLRAAFALSVRTYTVARAAAGACVMSARKRLALLLSGLAAYATGTPSKEPEPIPPGLIPAGFTVSLRQGCLTLRD